MSYDPEYEKALDTLSTLITGRQRADGKSWAHAFDMMRVYLERLDLQDDLSKLSIIHIAGTKGKGSTSAMVESMLRKAGYKTGLYTSPHLIDVRERIRINGIPVDKATFLDNFWPVYNTLKERSDEEAGMPAYFRFLTLLGFKIFLQQGIDVLVLEVGIGGRLDATNCVRSPVACGITPLGFDHMELLGHTLPEIAREKAGIFKKGCPAFSVPQREDALEMLRERAEDVGAPLSEVPGWDHFRPANPSKCLTVGLAGEHQKMNATMALTLAATWEARSPVAEAKHGQVAMQRAQKLLKEGVVAEEYAEGLAEAKWPGRAQVVYDDQLEQELAGPHSAPATPPSPLRTSSSAPRPCLTADQLPRLTFYLDGAHTEESMEHCALWFADEAGRVADVETEAAEAPAGDKAFVQRVLLFNCMQERDPEKLLHPLAETLMERRVPVHHALFVPPVSTYMKLGGAAEAGVIDLSWQQDLRGVWEAQVAAAKKRGTRLPPSAPLLPLPSLPFLPPQDTAKGAVLPNLQGTLEFLRRCVREKPSLRMQVLVTGSLYMVGDILKLLGKSC